MVILGGKYGGDINEKKTNSIMYHGWLWIKHKN